MPLKPKKQYTDAQLYVDGLCFLKECLPIVKNLGKDLQIQFGNDFIIDIRNMITHFSLSYRNENKKVKLKYAIESYKLLDRIDVSLQIMGDCDILTKKQLINLSLPLGNLIIQTEGWVKSLYNANGGAVKNTEPNVDF